ncbi:MAG: NUDIX domain-containing protein [Alphaproteobacteria bacterium]
MEPADDKCFGFPASAALVLKRGDDILLQLRQGTGYADGLYCLVGGMIDGNERASDAMIREAYEEAGIVIAPEDLHFACVMHSREPNREYINFFYTCDQWQNEIRNAEPEYCVELKFFPVDQLPENMMGHIRQGIMQTLNKQPYGEYGWDEREKKT